MTINEFIQKHNGKYLEAYDSSNMNQCVDVITAYVREVMNRPDLIPMGVATAYDLWTKNHKLIPFVDKIPNTLDAIPQAGDIIVWKGTYNGGVGHTAICTGWAGQMQFEVLSQNDPLGVPAVVKRYSYNHVAGWLRPKESMSDSNTITIPTSERDFLIGRATELKKVAEYLDYPQPDDIPSEHIVNLIGGLKSSITTAQRDRDNANKTVTSQKLEISNLNEHVLIMEAERDGLLAQAKKRDEMIANQRGVISELQMDVAERDTTIRELKKNVVSNLSVKELFIMTVVRFFRR